MTELGPIFDPTRSVVLVASAGTGKTWRLVRRYLRIVGGRQPGRDEPWARPDEVVAVTFTRTAAAEMRARVFAALTANVEDLDAPLDPDDDPVLAALYDQRPLAWRLALAEQVAPAPIGTLHSLCARMLAEFPELSGVPPDARPLEPAEQGLELDEFVSVWIEQVLDRPGHRAHALCVELLAAHPLAFLRRELRSMVDDRDWTLGPVVRGPAGVRAEAERATLASRDWRSPEAVARARESFVREQWRQYIHYLQQPLALVLQTCALSLAQGHINDRISALRRATAAMLRHVPEPDLSTIWADRAALLELRPHAKLGPGPAAALQNLRNNERVLSTRRRRPVMPEPESSLRPGHAEHVARWVTLASLAREDWLASLRQRAVLRYDDLELLAYELLDQPEAQAQLRGRYRHVLVDEYQDVNQVQAEIIDRLAQLCGEPEAPAKVFLIGDPKQSIYGFRGADPRVFQRAEVVYTGPEAEPKIAGELVRLADNRRSSPTLIRFFAQLFPPLFAGVLPWANITELGRPAELACLRDVLDHAPVAWDGEIVPIRTEDRYPGLAVDLLLRHADEASPDEALVDEASRVAAHVRGLLAGATLAGEAPLPRAREVAILVPRWTLAEDYRAALEREGIAADLAGGRGLLALPEVRDLINLVRLWADPQDELAALAVLRGPCFAISDLGLYALARWPGVARRVREADPDLPEFAELDELWEAWEDPDGDDDQPRWPRARPRRIRELLRHGRLEPARVIAALEQGGALVPAEGETLAALRARLEARLEADASALELGRDRFLAAMRGAGSRPSADLLGDVIVEFQLEAHWLESARGRRAVANAWRFVEHVRSLEPEGPDLQRLGSWLDAGAEPAPEGLIAPDADAVTITTWHGAKGKEWPVVVVAGVGEFWVGGGRTSWSGAKIPTLDLQTGTGQDALPVPRIRQPHVGFVAAEDPLHEPCTNMLTPLEAAESKRLIYVAMTRARDRLVISGEADRRAHVFFDDKPWLGLDKRFDMSPLLGEPKPAFLCRRPIELVIAGLDLPAAPGGVGVIRPRAATWSLTHLRVIEDAMLRAGRERPLPERIEPDEPDAVELARPQPPLAQPPLAEPEPKSSRQGRGGHGRQSKSPAPGQPRQLGFAGFFDAPEPEPASEPEPESRPVREPDRIWLAGPSLQIWTPSGGRSPWPVSDLDWDMPLPARRPVLLDEEDPRLLGELFHRAMEAWDFVAEPPASASIEPLTASLYPGRSPRERRELARWAARCCELVTADEALYPELRAARERDELFHEVEVDALVPASEDEHEGDHRIRGRIDLLWRGPDRRWNVLDYKVTSKLRSRAQMEELQWEYGPQLLLYRQALAGWRRGGEAQALGRMGLWLAPGGRAMWLVTQ